MARVSRKGVTPSLQWFAVCEEVVADPEGGVTIRRIFDGVQVSGFPGTMNLLLTAQFCNGQGQHKYWVKMVDEDGRVVETPESSFWLENRRAAHRYDTKIQLGLSESRRFTITAVLDGREETSIYLKVDGPEAILKAEKPTA